MTEDPPRSDTGTTAAGEPPPDRRRAFVDAVPVGLAWSDASGAVVYANARWRSLLQYDGPLPLKLAGVLELMHPSDRDRVADQMRASSPDQELRVRLRSCDGHRNLDLTVSALTTDPDEPVRFVGVLLDVTELTQAVEEIRRSEERFRSFTASLPIAAFRTDPAGMITWANTWLQDMSGYDLDGMLGMSAFDVVHPEDRESAYLRALDAVVADQPFESEHRFLCRDGTVRWIITRTSPVRDAEGRVVEHVGTMEDVTALHARSDVLARAAAHDTLTGLPNRASLERALDVLWAAAPGRDDIGLVFVDLDGFKAVNDTHGHQVGDAVLIEVGQRLSSAMRTGDMVSRLGGDEFVILCPGVTDLSVLDAVAERARRAIASPPIVYDDVSHEVGASLGTALGPGLGSDPADLLRRADDAMYLAKRSRT